MRTQMPKYKVYVPARYMHVYEVEAESKKKAALKVVDENDPAEQIRQDFVEELVDEVHENPEEWADSADEQRRIF